MADLAVTVTKDLIGIEDLALGEGTFTRSTSTGGTQTITKINPETLNFEVMVTPEEFGAVGDGVTDDSVALQEWLDEGGSLYMPGKTYASSKGPLILRTDGSKVLCHGTIKLLTGATRPASDGAGEPATSVLNIRDCKDVSWTGGILDGNSSNPGVNGIAVNHDLIFRPDEAGNFAYRVCISDIIVRNCVHDTTVDPGGATPHDGGIGNGGGKGVTFQFGGPQVVANNLRIHDCTIGISYEAGVSNETKYPDLLVNNVTVEDCMIGLLNRGTYGPTGGDEMGGDYFSSLWSNIAFVNCGTDNEPTGVDVDPLDFGVIDSLKCTSMRMVNFRIRNESGPVTPFRGQYRNCYFEGEVDAQNIKWLFHFGRNLNGADPTYGESPTRHCVFKVRAKLRGKGTAGDQITEAWITDAGTSYLTEYNRFELEALIGDGDADFTGNYSELTAPFYENDDSDDFASNNSYRLVDLGSGLWCEGTGVVRNVSEHHLDGQVPTMPTAGQFNHNNLTWENDVQAGIVRIRSANETGKVGLGNNAGSTVAYADTLGLVVGDGTWDGRHLMLGGYHLWVSSDKLYIKSSAPANATDGTVVGDQTA
jgi:hypothetical protein